MCREPGRRSPPVTPWGWVWERLPGPGVTKWAVLVAYGAAALLALVMLLDQPVLLDAVGYPLTVGVEVLLAVGGVTGVWAALHGWWRLERAAALLLSGAIFIYLVTVWLSYAPIDLGERVLRTGMVGVGWLFLGVRVSTIWGADSDPDWGRRP